MLMSDDFPTFERPMKAYSWRSSPEGHFSTEGLLVANLAVLIIIRIFYYIEYSVFKTIICGAKLTNIRDIATPLHSFGFFCNFAQKLNHQ